jgi:hypothetical protein
MLTEWLSPAVGGEVDRAVVSWANTGNVVSDNNQYATVVLASREESNYLIARQFAANIPVDRVIRGIEVRARAFRSAGTDAMLKQASLLFNDGLGGGLAGTPKTIDQVLTGSEVLYTFGGEFDRWGLTPDTITPGYASNANFGFALYGITTDGGTISIDHMELRVHFGQHPSLPLLGAG